MSGAPDSHLVGSATQLADHGTRLAADAQFEQAAVLFVQALQLNPGDALMHEMLAQCLMEAGQDEAAYEAATTAMRLRPGWSAVLLTLGRAARNVGMLKEAAAAFDAYLESATSAAAAAAVTAAEEEEEVAAAQQELVEVRHLLQMQLGHQLGLPGLRVLEQHGAAAGPGPMVWEAGVLLAWFLVQQQQQQQGGAPCSSPAGAAHSCGAACGAGSSCTTAAAEAALASRPSSSGSGLSLRGSHVLELGAGGMGIVGLAAACLGAEVTATDLPEMLPHLEASAALNRGMAAAAGGGLQVAALDWQQPDAVLLCPQPPAPQYDWLLGADLVFSPATVEPLAATVGAAVRHAAAVATTVDCSSSSSAPLKVLMCHKHRHEEVDAILLAALKAAVLHVRHDQYICPSSFFYKLCMLRDNIASQQLRQSGDRPQLHAEGAGPAG